jgi:hypothetical protein
MRDGFAQVRSVTMNFRGNAPAAALLALILAGCSGFGTSKPAPPPPEANAFPANYRTEIVTFLRQSLTNRADFRGALIAEPAMKPIGDSQHYVVCMQFGSRGQMTTKVGVFLSGVMTQFIDATPGQCEGAAYQPFKELLAATPS